ncbi:MAG: isopeptide-forming domain-containing fimbrial protein [Ruminococcaceae bacterium]|nr:isopeptide-forming domain-containing fimbrial protein [Oscillospiraceae bacterium]
MKKLASIFLALVMIFAITIPALAADTDVTIGTVGREYLGYQLMTVTTSLKCAENHNHEDTCYNYAYSVNDEYFDILKDVTGKDTKADIIKYLGTEVQSNTAEMQKIADDIYRAIKSKPEGTFTPKQIAGNTPTELDQGYWLFADVTDLNKEGKEANSVVMVDTKGKGEITVNPKEGLPSITKEVKDATTKLWGKAADARIGEDVEFKLTATVHDHLASYNSYKLEFQDNFEGYNLKEESIVVKVYPNNQKVEADAKTLTLNTHYSVTTGTDPDFKVVLEDIKTLDGVAVTADSVFEVTYKAELANGATIGEDGNPNTVKLVFSNNPYDTNSTGTTSDNVVVYTYKLVIEKRALTENGALLPGAAFSLYKMVDGVKTLIGSYTASDQTTFEWLGLDDGDYILEEDEAPEGYNKMADLEFTIAATYDIDGIDTLTVDGMTTDADAGKISDVVVNLTGTVLPETGGMGTMWLIIGGAMLVILAGVFMITRKKMSVFED